VDRMLLADLNPTTDPCERAADGRTGWHNHVGRSDCMNWYSYNPDFRQVCVLTDAIRNRHLLGNLWFWKALQTTLKEQTDAFKSLWTGLPLKTLRSTVYSLKQKAPPLLPSSQGQGSEGQGCRLLAGSPGTLCLTLRPAPLIFAPPCSCVAPVLLWIIGANPHRTLHPNPYHSFV
jgi:hypothetical protein